MTNKISNFGNDNRGSKPRTPRSALTKLMYDNRISSYYMQKNGYVNSGRISNESKMDVNSYSIKFLKALGAAMNMKWTTVGRKLLELQKQYPPLNKNHRKQNTYEHKSKNKNNESVK